MQLYSLLSLAFIQVSLSSALSVPRGHVKRRAETNATLYAYGSNASAWPIAYGLNDGCLYITQNPDDSSANITAVTWDLPSITQENWIVNASFVNGTSAGSLYILPEDDYAIGVLPRTQITEVNGTYSGFALFATQLVYNNDTNLEANFWAEETDTDGLYALIWEPEGEESSSGSFPVVIKGVEND
ncbi:putative glycoside hydrolase family 12 [Phaeomoniella chlamydospora]|uniref:Putative glycoside hydrolase family 12 n=1 Tax=Phaeomoniella chlamydospora TaxID=158046 RepID=A0A0G2EE74_PHACM|nr:putative glycoside hydrolase family 12 [Phaeomoniella chlamydospora]